MNRKRLIAVFALIACAMTSVSASGSDKWVTVSETDTETFSIKKDSFEHTTTKGGEEIAVVIGRTLSTKTKQVLLEKWYVRSADCRTGHGQLATLSVDGDFKYENPWVEDGGTAASSIAGVICSVHERVRQEEESKSL